VSQSIKQPNNPTSNQSGTAFVSDYPILATLALAAGGKMYPPEPDPVSGRLVFSFHSSSLAPNFESKVLDGSVTVNAKEVLTANNVVLGMVQRHQRARRQGNAR
jgi:hypothetical protein